VEETLDYLLREMRLPEGGFASAQDADTLGREGLTYVWAYDEIVEALDPDEAELVLARYGVTMGGNFEGASILYVAAEVDDAEGRLEAARRKLLALRDRRPQPARDDKALAAWNGLALAAFAEAGLRLGRSDYLDAARSLGDFLLGPMTDGRGRLLRTFRAGEAKLDGYLEDYANVASGLLELYTASGELRWLEEARRIALLAVDLFGDPEQGGFYFTASDGEALVARKKEILDQPTPSGNSMLALTLVRLARIYGDGELERLGVDVLRLGHGLAERAPSAVGYLLCALGLHFSPPREVAVVGDSEDTAAALRRAALERYAPDTVYAFATGPGDPALERVPLLEGKGLVDGRPAAYVCERFACRAPVTDPGALRELLEA
jgi:uncharacterized protein YyaL (SSP411 family)